MTKCTISRREPLKVFADSQVAAKGFADTGQNLSALLTKSQAREQQSRFEAPLLESLAANSIPWDIAFRERLIAETEQIVERY